MTDTYWNGIPNQFQFTSILFRRDWKQLCKKKIRSLFSNIPYRLDAVVNCKYEIRISDGNSAPLVS